MFQLIDRFRGVAAEKDFIGRLHAIYKTRRAAGDSFEEALELPLGIILASPGFLYLNEPNDAGDRRALSDRELAVRLAYFLWSSPPDQELLSLASHGELSKPDVLRQQVDRLIADSRSGMRIKLVEVRSCQIETGYTPEPDDDGGVDDDF